MRRNRLMHASGRRIIVFVKYPRPGLVKTRLAAALGAAHACLLYRCFVADTLQACDGVSAATTVFYDPAAPRALYAGWLGTRYPLAAQTGGDLGQRMQRAFQEAFAAGASQAVLIGSDIPDLPGSRIEEAFACLARSECVLGPALDGGYYLIGFTRSGFCPAVFDGCDWGAPTVLDATVRALEMAGCPLSVLPAHEDIDTADDLRCYLIRTASGPLQESYTRGYAVRSGIAARLLPQG